MRIGLRRTHDPKERSVTRVQTSAPRPTCAMLRRSYIAAMISLPDSNIRILAPLETLDYFDTQTVQLSRHVSPLEAWNLVMEDPQPLLKLAFSMRDIVSKRFGVKSIGGFSGVYHSNVRVGDYLDFFLVEHVDDSTLVLTERDRHLDVMTCLSAIGSDVSITSSVTVHNFFGRAYMLPVGVAHKFIVRNMLHRLQKKTAA
ncbi:MAG: DUF2867 domain-containing protein [Pseudomonadota bacterium]